MPRPAALRPSLPTALLLGLLALLLWGQCALLFPEARSRPPDLYGEVLRTDSLAASTLFLTLRLHNTLQTPVTVQAVQGYLRFGRRAFPFAAPPALTGRRLLIFDELTQPVAIPLALPPDSLARLRQLLSGPNERSGQAYLRWEIDYFTDRAPARLAQGTAIMHLPTLPQPKP